MQVLVVVSIPGQGAAFPVLSGRTAQHLGTLALVCWSHSQPYHLHLALCERERCGSVGSNIRFCLLSLGPCASGTQPQDGHEFEWSSLGLKMKRLIEWAWVLYMCAHQNRICNMPAKCWLTLHMHRAIESPWQSVESGLIIPISQMGKWRLGKVKWLAFNGMTTE